MQQQSVIRIAQERNPYHIILSGVVIRISKIILLFFQWSSYIWYKTRCLLTVIALKLSQ